MQSRRRDEQAERASRLAESPWFWLLLFSAAALALLLLIRPKHYARQERIVRMQAARDAGRQEAAERPGEDLRTREGADAGDTDGRPRAASSRYGNYLTLRPLVLIVALLVIVAAAGLALSRRVGGAAGDEGGP